MATNDLRLETLRGRSEIAPAVDDLARLRIRVFRAWPYLYDGSVDYEAKYLSAFAASDGAVLVTAHAGDALVGASTGLPLAHEHADFSAPLATAGYDVDRVFYCAESVLLPECRGRGAYRAFFERREDHARRLGFSTAVFCGVLRPDDHPARPDGYQPLDPVWRRFGYRELDGAVARYSWTDVGDTEETAKPMQYWIKEL
ncbi:GNAT family N-acetyltransferase [Thalassobaculum sp. OXR-137]|uniref:GNAT family N-acetyltransferase n=1 Tax=Thalassobaculum sp. OXR-137 TaxID=3100173 RepID=UPI002AC89A94|nr:GNAT family N-acetyltransferase [Thalassobaculum sp. OXR-137]WPZ35259.1 GNAT family N-acetyltransferase [Thalassobaculum sp. OXR-137]